MKLKKSKVLLGTVLIASLLSACNSTTEQAKEEEKPQLEIETVDIDAVKTALNDENSLVLDARINDVYNGWAVDGNKRGGHLPKASDFSANWLTCDYDEKGNLEGRSREKVLEIALKDKKIDKDKNIIVYDTNDKDANEVAQYLASKGIDKVKTYNASEWINDETQPLESYKNYELLVAPEIVNNIVNGKTPKNFTPAKDIKIVDIRWGGNKESGYMDGHIKSAIHINTDSFEPPKEDKEGNTMWRLADVATLEKLLLENGITSNDCVIATSPEPMAASRFAVICQYMGVKDVRVMNGGFVEWTSLGYPLEKGENLPIKATDFGIKPPAKPELIDSLDKVKDIMGDESKMKDFTLVDNRTWEEFIGKIPGYSYHHKCGRIKGAVFGHAGVKSSSSMSYYRNLNKTMRNENEIKALWAEDNIDTSKHLSFMCGSGWRAAEVLWDAEVMGLTNVSMFSDGWIAWSNAHYPSVKGE